MPLTMQCLSQSTFFVTRELNWVKQIRHPWLGKMILIKKPKIIACLCGLFKSPSTVWILHCKKCQTVYTINWYFTWCFVPEHKIMEEYKGELYVTENILILWKILPIRRGLPLCKYVCSNNLHWAYVYSSRKARNRDKNITETRHIF